MQEVEEGRQAAGLSEEPQPQAESERRTEVALGVCTVRQQHSMRPECNEEEGDEDIEIAKQQQSSWRLYRKVRTREGSWNRAM